MAAQLSYNYTMQRAVPGGAVDTSPHSIVARANGETVQGKIRFGLGVVQGSNPGKDVKLPVSGATADLFEGIISVGVAEMDMDGTTVIRGTDTLGVMRWGKRWVRVPDDLTIAYGDALYLIVSGDNAGYFTNDDSGTLAVNGRFLGAADSGDIAPVELYNQSAAAEAELSSLDARVTALENA
jgi:hypothetical protein